MKTDLVEQKSMLAKLMAAENITVEHKKIPTAAFDVKNRVLYLPILKWKPGSNVYDLFCAHEVGHALWTPYEGWHSSISKKGKGYKSFLNVIEDARIEKKIKRKFAGARKCMLGGYSELMNEDFFGLRKMGVNANDLGLIDRINLYTKAGTQYSIEFTDEEKEWVEKVERTETWEDVVEVTDALYEWCKENESETDNSYGDFDEDDLEETKDWRTIKCNDRKTYCFGPNRSNVWDHEWSEQFKTYEFNECKESNTLTNNKSFWSDEVCNLISTHKDDFDSEEEYEDDYEDESGEMSDIKDESDEENEEDSEKSDKTSNKSSENKSKDGNPSKELDNFEGGTHSDGMDNGIPEEPSSLTDDNFREREEEMSDMSDEVTIPNYLTFPKINTEAIVIDHKVIHKELTDYYNDREGAMDAGNELLKTFKKNNGKMISYMIKEFEMKKAADIHRRAYASKKGTLDMNKIHAYKYSENLFRQITNLPEGKNHGMVMFIDWSGSMNGYMKETIEQLINLTMFCSKVQIPFEVYAFTDHYRDHNENSNSYGFMRDNFEYYETPARKRTANYKKK